MGRVLTDRPTLHPPLYVCVCSWGMLNTCNTFGLICICTFFIYRFENALRRYDASVTIPYLDSTYEDLIGSNTMNSILWTEGYLGNVDGNLRTGPFKNWR